MRFSVVIAAVAAAIACFVAGFLTGNLQDHWKVANQAGCTANIQIVDPGPLSTPARGKVQVRPLFVGGGRRAAVQAAVYQIERCDGLSGLATLDPLASQRLNAMIVSP